MTVTPEIQAGLERISLSLGPDDSYASIVALGAAGLTKHLHSAIVYNGMPVMDVDSPIMSFSSYDSSSDLGLWYLARVTGIATVIVDARISHNNPSRIVADVGKIARSSGRLNHYLEDSPLNRNTTLGQQSYNPEYITVEYASCAEVDGIPTYDPVIEAAKAADGIGSKVVIHLSSSHEDSNILQILGNFESRHEDLFQNGIDHFIVAGADLKSINCYLPTAATISVTGAMREGHATERKHPRNVSYNEVLGDPRVILQLGSVVMKAENPVEALIQEAIAVSRAVN